MSEQRIPLTCEYGYPTMCGAKAVYICRAPNYPYDMPACEEHARLMHGFRWAPSRCETFYKILTGPAIERAAPAWEKANES
jgi:hypothetical protein